MRSVTIRVMATLGPLQTSAECERTYRRNCGYQQDFCYCLWVVELRNAPGLIGTSGLKPSPDGTPIEGKIEIGWQLAFEHWGQSYAREAAEASLAWAWANLDVPEVFAITSPANSRSRGLMLRLGMSYVEGGDFDHPALAEGDPLRRHVLYRIQRPQ
jgi:RimJ/RimL family protein N-acetyltransferase